MISSADSKANFYLYSSQYQNLSFTGKVIWYSSNKFGALVSGDEGLMVADFTVD